MEVDPLNPGLVRLIFNGGGVAIIDYTTTIAGFNCLGPNVFTRGTSTGFCNSWPATLTVSPAA